MKRYLLIIAAIAVILSGGYLAVVNVRAFQEGAADIDVHAVFASRDGHFVRNTGSGWEELLVKGVDLSASVPGHNATDFVADRDDYLRWMEHIGEMGANTLRVNRIMDDDFYDALYEYNTQKETPLYLIQCFGVRDKVLYGAGDAYRKEFLQELIREGHRAVDIIHGNLTLATNKTGGTGTYGADLSPYTIGYIVGTEWTSDVIAYTENRSMRPDQYEGTYFKTTSEADAFEAMLAQVLDDITAYEAGRYRTLRCISFINDPQYDPFDYEDGFGEVHFGFELSENDITYARQLGKYASLDAEHIAPTQEMTGGYFAAYHAYTFCPSFDTYFSQAQQEKLAARAIEIDHEASYDGYLKLLADYHSMPVLIAPFGASSARGVTDLADGGAMTEREQGEYLVRVYEDIVRAGLAGGVIDSWQDTWESTDWNTAYAQDADNNRLWHDVQSVSQNRGLMAFDLSDITIDGDPSDWEEIKTSFEADGIRVSTHADAEGYCLLLEGDPVSEDACLYLPIDIGPETGEYFCMNPMLRFEDRADFLLSVNGETNSHLLVTDRYDAARQRFLNEMEGIDPFVRIPDEGEGSFVAIRMPTSNHTMVRHIDRTNFSQKFLPAVETGRLNGGVSRDGGSDALLRDIAFGTNTVEIRLPWGLLNVANPQAGLVHGDYYRHYGVRLTEQPWIRIGLSLAGNPDTIRMTRCGLKWDKDLDQYTERLKESYYVLQQAWR